MTTERTPPGEQDPEATVEMPKILPEIADELEDLDPEQTFVREDFTGDDWESTVIRRVAPRVAAVRERVEQASDDPFGWESDSLRRLSQELK